MSTSNNEQEPTPHEGERSEQQDEIAAVQDELDEQADGEGLAAEADRGEATGLSEG